MDKAARDMLKNNKKKILDELKHNQNQYALTKKLFFEPNTFYSCLTSEKKFQSSDKTRFAKREKFLRITRRSSFGVGAFFQRSCFQLLTGERILQLMIFSWSVDFS